MFFFQLRNCQLTDFQALLVAVNQGLCYNEHACSKQNRFCKKQLIFIINA